MGIGSQVKWGLNGAKLLFFFLFATITVLGSRTWAGEIEPATAVPNASPLLVLLAATDAGSIETERRLVAELRLTLDGVPVEPVAIEKSDFLTVTLPEQLAVVQPLIRRFLAKAAVWITSGGSSIGHLIQFVVSESGSATVRTVEAGSPEDLALAVRELLDSTYLIDIKEKETKEQNPLPKLSWGLQTGLNGGMSKNKGPSFCGGIGVELRYRFIKGFYGGIIVGGKLGPRKVEDDGIILGWRVEPGVFFSYLFRIGRFGIGPYLHLSALGSSLNAVLDESEYSTVRWWAFRGALGIEIFLEVSREFCIVLDWTIGGISRTAVVERENSQTEALTTPRIDYSFTLGFITNVL
jgi:hypothetical protein